ncbi:dipeptide epimerase [Enterococcus sp. BWB1-3]|uniref:dipeptide epimerase n=1 Tax=unclassified Enterococcus TaxID=2608891 RepID=UPI00192233D9|nr:MULTISPECIES: dipeptide epimerase [unclassified Enterococcus]MBL1229567.1 dipeptide epimerase [Enterococcus sp. BWB1-3]MCB5950743.1 dipeptide epimerase [Enterococcus sp. BWT-B8]
MKITEIKVTKKAVELKEPVTISLGTVTESISAVIEIETDEGIIGYGEGSPGILITGETLDGTTECIKMFSQQLIGTDPTDIEKVHSIMNKIAAHAPSAKAAIDLACYDLLGKKTSMPVYKLVGGYDSAVETDMTVGINSPEIMSKNAKRAVSQGFSVLKVKVGTGMTSDIERIKAIREAVGNQIKLRLDANQAWGAKEALQMIEKLSEYNIELIEQPVKYHDIEGLAYVRTHSPVPIMSDESCFNAVEALRLIEKRAVDIVNIKLMKCGGIYEALKIVNICEAAGIECMIGCMIEESNIGVTAAAHLAAGKKNITRADLDASFALRETELTGGVPLEPTPSIVLDNVPGLGLRRK